MNQRRRRTAVVLLVAISMCAGAAYEAWQQDRMAPSQPAVQSANTTAPNQTAGSAVQALGTLAVKGRAPKTGYKRSQFGDGWLQVGTCNARNHVLKRDMTDVKTVAENDCTVISGTLDDPYTGKKIAFMRGPQTSDDVQIDHVVALSDAWQKGAQQLTVEKRVEFGNDSLNLLAVDGPANQKKSDADAATWLPPNKAYRCPYIARQIAVKVKYTLWVTQAEHDAMQNILNTCPGQLLPEVILYPAE